MPYRGPPVQSQFGICVEQTGAASLSVFFSSQSLTASVICRKPGVLEHYHNLILVFRTWQSSLKILIYKIYVACLVSSEPISVFSLI
jgi:hypothetical protein